MSKFFRQAFEQILKLHIGMAQPDNTEMFRLLAEIYPLELRRFASLQEHNGWIVPEFWKVKKAQIFSGSKLLYDGSTHPLAVASYSYSFSGILPESERRARIFTKPGLPSSIPFHCLYSYRPWLKEWAFCVPHDQYEQWPSGDLRIELETEFSSGEMLVGLCQHKGSSSETIVLNAHTCHPCQFNDDLAGVAVLLELFRALQGRETRYSYLGVLAPEHLGSVFYLNSLSEAERLQLKCGSFVEMTGIQADLALQESFFGDHIIDRVAEFALQQMATKNQGKLYQGRFRTVVGNDETVWEGPGIEIPFISISRCSQPGYYPEYHTSADNLEIASDEKMDEVLVTLEEMIAIFERDCIVHRHFEGLVALSNPKFGLYVDRPEPTVVRELSPEDLRMGILQDYLPRLFDGSTSVFAIAKHFGIGFERLYEYLQRFAKTGLISLEPVPSLDWYATALPRSALSRLPAIEKATGD